MEKIGQSLGQKLIIGSGYSYLSLLINKAITAISSIFLARYLGPTNLGMISIINYLLLLLLFFTGFGIPTASVKLISEYRERAPEKAGEFIVAGFVFNLVIIITITLVYYSAASAIANQIYREAKLSGLIRISAVALFFFSLNQYGNSVVQAFAEFKRLSLLLIFNSVFGLLALLLFTKLFHLAGPVISQSLTSIATFFLLLRVINFLKRKYLLSFLPRKIIKSVSKYFHELFSLALPVFLSGLVMTPVLTILTTLLSRLRGFTAVGFFNVAYSLTQVILFVPTAVGTPFIPLATKIAVEDSRGLTDFLTKTIYGVGMIVMLLSFLMSFFSYEVISLFYGAEYSPAQDLLILLSAATFLASFGYVVGYYLLAVGKMWLATLLNLLWCIFIITPAFHLIKLLGLFGLGLDYLAAYILLTSLLIFYLRQDLKVPVRRFLFLLGTGVLFPSIFLLVKIPPRFHPCNIGLLLLFFILFLRFVDKDAIRELVGSRIKSLVSTK